MRPFHRLTGLIRPAIVARVQTDGSYHHAQRLSRTAVILQTDGEYRLMKTYMEGEHANSTESEWASVLDGLQFSITKDQGAVEIENDNLAVIEAIIRRRAKKEVERYYLHTILEESADLEWLAIRWIPRELNRADTLFR
jgi:ribonuclease HI